MLFANVQPETIAIMIPIVAILGTFAIVIVAIVVEGRKKDLAHKERLFALEKGLPLPELPEKKEKPVYATRRAWGLVWFGLGLAVTIGLATNPESSEVNAWAWGLIPTFIGAGLLIAAVLDKKEWEQRRSEEEVQMGTKPPSQTAAAPPAPPAPHESGDI
jgi:hypothetical protein